MISHTDRHYPYSYDSFFFFAAVTAAITATAAPAPRSGNTIFVSSPVFADFEVVVVPDFLF